MPHAMACWPEFAARILTMADALDPSTSTVNDHRALPVAIPHAAIVEFCRAHQVARLSFFGSVLRKDFGDSSDVDVLVEFQPGARVGYFAMARMGCDLSALLGRPVDLRTPAELHASFRNQVLAEALPEYVAAW